MLSQTYYNPQHLGHKHWPAQASLQGRALAIRTTRGSLDITYIAVHFSPYTTQTLPIASELLLWLQNLLDVLPCTTGNHVISMATNKYKLIGRTTAIDNVIVVKVWKR